MIIWSCYGLGSISSIPRKDSRHAPAISNRRDSAGLKFTFVRHQKSKGY